MSQINSLNLPANPLQTHSLQSVSSDTCRRNTATLSPSWPDEFGACHFAETSTSGFWGSACSSASQDPLRYPSSKAAALASSSSLSGDSFAKPLGLLVADAIDAPALTIGIDNFTTSRGQWPQPNGKGTPVTITYSYSNLLDGTLNLRTDILRDAIEEALNLWADHAPLNFIEVADSGPLPDALDSNYFSASHPHIRFGHHAIPGYLGHAFFPSPNLASSGMDGDAHFDINRNWATAPAPGFFDFLEIAVHEIGHALGLDHELNQPAIMSPIYAGRYTGLGTAFLLPDDISGIQRLYGAGLGSVTPGLGTSTIQRWATGQGGFWDTQQWVAGDFNGDGRDDMAKAFYENNAASIDVHLSSSSNFTIQRWSTGQGGFWDTQQWVAGDFNGDGRDDMAKAFYENNAASIDVHLSTGSSFVIQRWATGQGGFWDAQQWVAGDFNGDGRDDMAKAFYENNAASIDVHLSTGSSFVIQRWMTQQGGFRLFPQWVVGDFNGDGRDDIASAFFDNGLGSVDVHLSSGSSFTMQRWATGQGAFWPTQQWVAGDFNGDGRDDVAKAFGENGAASLDVHLSNGSNFTMQRWATGQGGFWPTQQWVAGDFNGDGRDDMAKAFYENNAASIDVHIARGIETATWIRRPTITSHQSE